jgi:hypothetical protein
VGPGPGLQSAGDAAFLFDSLKILGRPEEFQKVFGRYWGVASVGVIGGLLLGAPMAAATDLSLPIIVSAGIALVGTGVAFSFREPALGLLAPSAPDAAARPAEALGREARLSFGDLIRESFRLAYQQPQVRYALLYAAVLGVATFVPILFIQPFLVRTTSAWQPGAVPGADASWPWWRCRCLSHQRRGRGGPWC